MQWNSKRHQWDAAINSIPAACVSCIFFFCARHSSANVDKRNAFTLIYPVIGRVSMRALICTSLNGTKRVHVVPDETNAVQLRLAAILPLKHF
jgi:hypothetical protein